MRLFISIILLLASLAVVFWWGGALWSDVQAFKAEKNAYESVLLRLNALRKTRDTLLSSYNSIPAEDLKRIKNFLPENLNSGLLVVQMSNLAGSNGLLLKNINISPLEEKTAATTLTLSLSGSYRDFVGFLKSLEKSLRLIDVFRLSFSAGKENFYDFNLEAKSYTQK
ncbi:MAG: type 4a pilus biogenesis protein PilO [Candidatus Niyogibacteria bacterium]|nr:type 4a pilus biogenesis protein PilO [Candidatus Niyogibacteria bacterium]